MVATEPGLIIEGIELLHKDIFEGYGEKSVCELHNCNLFYMYLLNERYIDDILNALRWRGNDMAFSEDIKRIRRKAFLSQDEFAKQIGVSYTTVNRWEKGKAKPNLKAMKLIDDYCKQNGIDFDISEQIDK